MRGVAALAMLAAASAGLGPGSQSGQINALQASDARAEASTGGKGSHGGYCGPAVKPIALNMLQACAAEPTCCTS